MFNNWKPFPKKKPRNSGWYLCSMKYGPEPNQEYVMMLWWDPEKERWKNNLRLDVFNTYKVFGYNEESGRDNKRLYYDQSCYRSDVIAFKNIPKTYKTKIKDNE